MLHAGVIPAVVPPVEFGDPEAVIVFDDGFWDVRRPWMSQAAANPAPAARCRIAGAPIFGDQVADDQGIGKALEFFPGQASC